MWRLSVLRSQLEGSLWQGGKSPAVWDADSALRGSSLVVRAVCVCLNGKTWQREVCVCVNGEPRQGEGDSGSTWVWLPAWVLWIPISHLDPVGRTHCVDC